MSLSNSGSNNSYDDETVEQLASRVAELETTVENQADRIDELEATVEEQDDEIEELQDELREAKAHSGRERAELSGRVATVEDKVDNLEPHDGREADSSGSDSKGEVEETTALERVCALPEHVVADNLTANQRRARSVARRIKEYGKSVPAGVAITSSRIKRVLTAQEDTTIHRQTVSRVADFLERFGDGGVQIKETRGGKTTVVFDDEIVDAVTSVVTDDTGTGVTPATI